MQIPDELFETNKRVEIHYDAPNNFWRITTSNGLGRGKTLDEALKELTQSEKLSHLQKKINTYLAAPLSSSQIEALSTFLDNNG